MGPRILWMSLRLGKEKLIFVSANGLGSDTKEEERNTFWSNLTECSGRFRKKDNIVLNGDLNACPKRGLWVI